MLNLKLCKHLHRLMTSMPFDIAALLVAKPTKPHLRLQPTKARIFVRSLLKLSKQINAVL